MTEAQLTACRENAQHSTGPRTIEGKKRARLNAFRHGPGQIIMHTPEDAQAFWRKLKAETTAPPMISPESQPLGLLRKYKRASLELRCCAADERRTWLTVREISRKAGWPVRDWSIPEKNLNFASL